LDQCGDLASISSSTIYRGMSCYKGWDQGQVRATILLCPSFKQVAPIHSRQQRNTLWVSPQM